MGLAGKAASAGTSPGGVGSDGICSGSIAGSVGGVVGEGEWEVLLSDVLKV